MTKSTTMKNASRSLARLGVEALEDRRLLNGKSLFSLVNFLAVPSAAPALVQSNPSLAHIRASVAENTGHGSGGLHLGEVSGPHSLNGGSGKLKSELDSDKEGGGAKLKLAGGEEADLGGKLGKGAQSHSNSAHEGGKGKDLRHDASSSDSDSDVTNSNASAVSAGTGESPFFAPAPRPGSQPGGLPSLGIVFPHSPEGSDRDPPPDVPTAWSFLLAPTVLSTEETEQRNSPQFSLKVPGAGDRSWDTFWADFLPTLPKRLEGVLSAVAVGLEGAGQTQSVSEEPTPDTPEAGLLTAELPHGAGLGADLERLFEELNGLGSGIKDAIVRGRFTFWLLAGAMATVGCEVARRRRQARAPLGLATDEDSLRWFPEVSL